jgi:hypothetical protein
MPLAIIGFGVILFALSWAANANAGGAGSSTSPASPASSTGTSGSTGPLPNPSTSQGSVIQQTAAVFMAAGLNKTAAAGIIGNAYQESSWNPASVGDGGGGLWGFTADPQSLADLQAYAQTRHVTWTNPTVQAEFLLKNLPAGDIATLNQQGSPAAAAAWFMNNWEHPLASSENLARRQQGAQLAYNQIN